MEGGGKVFVSFFFLSFFGLTRRSRFRGEKMRFGAKIMAYCQTHSDYEASKNAFKVGSVKF